VVVASALLLALPGAGLAAGQFTEFPIPTANAQALDIIAGGDGNLWYTESHTVTIGRITPNGTTREFAFSGAAPQQLGVAQDGNVWFSVHGVNAHSVARIKPLGAIKFFAIPSTDSYPGGLHAGPDGNLWIAEGFSPPKIGKLGPGGLGGNPPVITEADSPATIGDITAGIDGNMWFAEAGNTFASNPGHIGRITTANVVTEFTTGLTANSSPFRIAAGHDGNIWFTEFSGNRIGRVTTSGVIDEFPLPTGATQPHGIAAGPDGNMWFAYAQGIGRITPQGSITTFPVPGDPYGIAAGPDGYMWFTEFTGNKVGRIATDVVPPTTGNLLLSPGFEGGTPLSTNTASSPVPGWTTVPSFSEAGYGASGLPGTTVGSQVGGGDGFGWGGTMSANIGKSWALQHVDVAREAEGIDAGRATVTLSGLLGGIGAQEDYASVKALFLSASGDEIGSAEIGPVTRDDRQSQTTLLPRSATAALPAGTRAVRVVATSVRLNGGPTNDGLFDNLSLTLDVSPAPPPDTHPPVDVTAPVVDSLTASPRTFAVAAAATAVVARKKSVPRGTRLGYRLTEGAVVTLTFERATAGRRAGGRCVKATSRNRRARRCTLYVSAGTLIRSSPLGASSLSFSGRIGRKALAVGPYRITAIAKDAAGNKSSARHVAIKVVKP
jgi:streptogramin lyase